METEQASRVRVLNDAFRRRGSSVMITPGVEGLADLHGLLEEVRWYNHFDSDNDPYGEHDFASFMWGSHKLFWKIDYYNESLDGWADPASPECRRVLTVMLASEY